MNHRLAEVTTGKFLGPNIERIGVTELAEDFLRDYRINAKSSFDDAEARWRLHIQPFFGPLHASQVTSSLLNTYVDKRQEAGAKNATINRELAALKRMWQQHVTVLRGYVVGPEELKCVGEVNHLRDRGRFLERVIVLQLVCR